MSKDIAIGPFNYAKKNLPQNYNRTIFEKSGVGGGVVALQFIDHLKRALELE